MKNTVVVVAAFVVAVLLISALGCQTAHRPQWLTPPRGCGGGQFLGQAPSDDPFFHALRSAPATQHSAPVAQQSLFDPFAPVQQSVLATDVTAMETEREREHIRALATSVREDAPSYMQPLNPWDGPFANRTRGKNLEQDIIRKVGYDQVSARIFSDEPEYEWEKEERKTGFDWSVLDPANSFSRVRDWLGLGPDENKATVSMQKGREILLANPDLKDKKKNLEAAKHFMDAAKRFPDSVLEEDALHLAAECYFFADDYSNAFSAYHTLVVKYQHSKHVDNAVRRLFLIGRYWEQEAEQRTTNVNFSNRSLPKYDVFGFAKKAYETIFTYDPLGPVSDDALMALANAYFKRGRHQGDVNFDQAAFYYQRLREEHPSSPYVAKAYEYELYARTQAYLGPEHPSRSLEEARKLAEATLWLNAELGSDRRATILGIKETIIEKEAGQLWARGQFYDHKKRHYAAARTYYRRLIADYPQTEYAERARRRLEQIENLPDTPPIFGLPINPFKAAEE